MTYTSGLHSVISFSRSCRNFRTYPISSGFIVHGSAADVIRGILVSGATFAVAWAALVSRYDKPRLVAESFIDKLLQVPVSSVDSLSDLNKFMSVFGEGISVLFQFKGLSSQMLSK